MLFHASPLSGSSWVVRVKACNSAARASKKEGGVSHILASPSDASLML